MTQQKKQAPAQTERKFQADCFQWFHNTYPHLRGLLFHVPNGEKRDKVTASILKASGVVAGIPDLIFCFRSKTYFFELKNPDGSGRLSEDQKKIHKQLDTQRFIVWVIDDLEAFKGLIKAIIADTTQQFTFGLVKEKYYYKHKIFDFLYNMGNAEIQLLDEIVEEENQIYFTQLVQEFIVEGYDKLAGFEILFTPDYKGFYKRLQGSDAPVEYMGKTYVS